VHRELKKKSKPSQASQKQNTSTQSREHISLDANDMLGGLPCILLLAGLALAADASSSAMGIQGPAPLHTVMRGGEDSATVEVFETQERRRDQSFWSEPLWSDSNWTDRIGDPSLTPAEISTPEGWEWSSEWSTNLHERELPLEAPDDDWCYAMDRSQLLAEVLPDKSLLRDCRARRRRWFRPMRPTLAAFGNAAGEELTWASEPPSSLGLAALSAAKSSVELPPKLSKRSSSRRLRAPRMAVSRLLRRVRKACSWLRDDFNHRGLVLGLQIPLHSPSSWGPCARFRLAQSFQSWEQNEALPLVTLTAAVNRECVMTWMSVSYRIDSLVHFVALKPARPKPRSMRRDAVAPLPISPTAELHPESAVTAEAFATVPLSAAATLARRKRLQYLGFSVGYRYNVAKGYGAMTRGLSVSYMPTTAILWEALGLRRVAQAVVAVLRTALTAVATDLPQRPPAIVAVFAAWLAAKTMQLGGSVGVRPEGIGGSAMLNVSPFYFSQRGRQRPKSAETKRAPLEPALPAKAPSVETPEIEQTEPRLYFESLGGSGGLSGHDHGDKSEGLIEVTSTST
jgi:hypothetical protein